MNDQERKAYKDYLAFAKKNRINPKPLKEWLESYRAKYPAPTRRSRAQAAADREGVQVVVCDNCKKEQPDHGVKMTCTECGFSPLPSWSYPKESCFHPSFKRTKRR